MPPLMTLVAQAQHTHTDHHASQQLGNATGLCTGLTWRTPVRWMLGVSLLFTGVYGFCNWYTAQRTGVGSLYFAWEQSLPVIPLLIYPYLSLALFFLGSFWLCDRPQALYTHGWRIGCAVLISAACYLLVPVRYGFERPTVDGFCGGAFALLHWLDQPYNETPSLHMSLLLILWPVYAKRTTGWWRGALDLWFGLIAVSVVLVYQHHVIGALGGVFVAGLSYWLVPTPRPQGERLATAEQVRYRPSKAIAWEG